MWEKWIGQRSKPVTNPIERGAVAKFAQAIGDDSPLYTDEEAARKSVHGRLIAPPTYPMILDYGQIEGLKLPESGLIHGEQQFDYRRPLYVDEKVTCYETLRDVKVKQARSGEMTILVIDRVGEDSEGERIFTSTLTIIVTEAVKRRWMAS
ncbi:MAG: MaoC family dehydratase N-terminal domain-containing protein [Firmicutes bacterium]|uniref:Acyl dehydratase n=1 Tax=Melghirimyces thermohalophilus TaxID=1236220 RepID=A0A1G6MQ39_9BACL|nr:MaoC family dehydratase N-terminal domain-containing protein [Melghirimyces thermohalophilus]MDA8354556.1 MaoC family dehydratase N-terminal domain-containing protein [Bacillota bacterium]SDC57639.1 Acyl dehydratase [Melghirimyces thermohalophilus]